LRITGYARFSEAIEMMYVYLALAIVAEVIGTSALNASEKLTRFYPSVLVVVSYCAAFYFLSLTLGAIPIGVAYAIWEGAGIVLITVVGWVWFKQSLDTPALLGMAFIVVGVVVINLFSKTVPH
jgi:small multidrug resistance pump